MRTVFLPFLLNGLTGDPGLWVDLMDEGRSVLLDLGDLRHASSRKLLRVERVVVSHTHMDHFVGFDHLLRLCLGRERELVITGPAGFLERVRGKITAYTWNLIDSYPIRLIAEEIDGDTIRTEVYSGPGRMRPEPLADRAFSGVVHAERLFTVHVTILDHGIPVLGTALREVEHLSVDRDRLRGLGLRPGAWLREFKQSVRRSEPADGTIEAEREDGDREPWRLGDLAAEILRRSAGQKIAYVTDVGFSAENVESIRCLATGVDVLVCEAAFLHSDVGLAAARHHLTARQAGEIAREVGARRLAPFHVSPRYQGREEELLSEAGESFGGPVLRLPSASLGA